VLLRGANVQSNRHYGLGTVLALLPPVGAVAQTGYGTRPNSHPHSSLQEGGFRAALFGRVQRPLTGLARLSCQTAESGPEPRLSLEAIPLRLGVPPSNDTPHPGTAMDIRTLVKER
jgi:hypothetical protein